MKKISLQNLPDESVSHNAEILKKVFIRNGEVLNITQIAKILIRPGQIADSHNHRDMYELFLIEEGEGVIEINGQQEVIKKDDLIVVEPGEFHEVRNTSENELNILVIGIEKYS